MKRKIDFAYSNYIYYSRALNYTSKILELNKEKLQNLRSLIAADNELVELLQQRGEDNNRTIEDVIREREEKEKELKELEGEIEIREIQIEALKATINKEKEILLNVGVELPDISETKEHQGAEYGE